MPTNINFVGGLDSEASTQVNFNLPKTLSLGTVKKSFNNSGLSEAEGCSYLALNNLSQTALLGKASLIINPSSFSENTVYADLPANSTLGDLVFSRATDAWRTNSQGLVQRTPWNLLQYSEQFDAAGVWVKQGAGTGTTPVVTSNFAIAPNGTLTADRVQCSNIGGSGAESNYSLVIQSNVPLRTTGTISIYLRSLTGATQNVLVYWSAGQGTVFQVTSQWQRFILPNASATTTGDGVVFGTRGGSAFYSGGDAVIDIAVWGAQVVEGLSALDYFTTTNRQNVPRIDYSLGGCPTLLMEPQRTNLFTYSEELSNVIWQNIGLTVTNNTIAAPSGIVNADTLVATTANTQHSINQNAVVTTGSTLTFSCYVKNNGGNFVQLVVGAIGFTILDPYQNFNLQTGTLASGNIPTSTITNVGNGWYRITSTVTTAQAGTASFFVSPILSGTTGRVNSFVGDGINGIYAWGAQLEAGAYPTSYIPTTTATVTRNVDVANKASISSLLGQTEGTIFYDIHIPQPSGLGTQAFASMTNDAGTLFYTLYVNNTLSFDMYIGGTYTFALTTATGLTAGRNRVALVYKAGAYKLFLNGVLSATSTNATPITNTISKPGFGAGVTPIYFYEFAAFKTALSDAELELLTGNWFDTYAAMATFYNYTLQ
jgi:hypothetical protein